MTATTRRVHVSGFRDEAPSLAAVRLLFDWLADGVDKSLRLRVEGHSTPKGPRPKWASASRDIGVERWVRGSIDLDVTSPSVGELLRGEPFWNQPSLFMEPLRPDLTPLDLFTQSVHDAVVGRDDAPTLDGALLSHIASVRSLLDLGAEQVRLPTFDVEIPDIVVSRVEIDRVESMASRTPETRRARIVGDLDTLSLSTSAFILLVGAQALRGVFVRKAATDLRSLFGQRVCVEGDVVYRASGRPLRFEALSARIARPEDEAWAHLPVPQGARRAAQPQVVLAPRGFDDLFDGVEIEEDEPGVGGDPSWPTARGSIETSSSTPTS